VPGDETIVPTWGASSAASLPEPGYQLGEVIGRGGMGEVVVAHDQRIGREVAVKRIRSHDPTHDAITRFLREARIQARLDHPAIVPVYELGTDANGRPYFTMKRLAGETLAKKLSRNGPVQPLLRAFIDVCLAIQLAHSRGVVHRDLKPSNIMLGDYGEVYVLDWGVARVLTDRKRTTQPSMAAEIDDGTTAGAILGTPGYMAPEQVRGFEADTKADVYALGAILFEILAGEALHPRGEAALSSTLTTPQEAPTRRVAERRHIPPELDGVCFDALAEEPKERPSARELADRVQAYLDGDRDMERRRTLAAEQVVEARRELSESPQTGRAAAIRRAGRALALDPESTEAADLVTGLLLEPPAPEHYPHDLKKFLASEDLASNRSRARQGMWTYLALFSFWLAVPFMQVKSWGVLVGFYALLAMGAVISWRNSRRGYSSVPVTLVITGLLAIVFTRISGPFILTPIVICAALMQLSAIRFIADRLWISLVWCVLVVLSPFVFEWTGLMNETYAVGRGAIVGVSDVFDMRGSIDEVILVTANFVFLAAAGTVAVFISRRRLSAQRQLQVQAWHLHQLLPTAKRWQTQPNPIVSPPK
jgi:serine/threonine-protein kinase